MHSEQLRVPLSWWLLALAFAASLVVAIWAYLGIGWGLGAALVSLAVVALWFEGYGRVPVAVDERGVTAGPSLLEWPYVGRAEALDPDQLSTAMHEGSNAAAYYLTRPYTKGAVRIEVDDPADPHPYWLVSTRHPQRVAELVNERVAR